MPEVSREVMTRSNRFAFKLLAEMSQSDQVNNLFISPFGIFMCLMLAYNGAGGETQDAMAEVLELQGLSQDEINRTLSRLDFSDPPQDGKTASNEEINKAYKVLKAFQEGRDTETSFGEMRVAHLIMQKADKHFRLTVANAIWARSDLPLKSEFLHICQELLKAHVQSLDFSDPSAPHIINEWVNQATRGTIREIINEIPQLGALILANAIYFKAFWRDQFSRDQTKQRKFTLLDGKQVPCSMMYKKWHFDYWQDADLQIIALPYHTESVAKDISMYVVLPQKGVSPVQFASGLTAEKWELLVSQVSGQSLYGEIGLPRFQVEYDGNLTDLLKSIGLAVAFEPLRADFSPMCHAFPSPWFSAVRHKAFIRVDEDGTEAGAATIVMYAGGKLKRPAPQFHMLVDHPFFYAIRDNITATILFMGYVLEL